MITRCPSCETRFQVTPMQLSAARGLVRCGACLSVFAGAEHLVEAASPVEAPAPLPDLPDGASRRRSVLGAGVDEPPATAAEAVAADTLPAARVRASESEPEPEPEPEPESRSESEPFAAEPAPGDADIAARLADAEWEAVADAVEAWAPLEAPSANLESAPVTPARAAEPDAAAGRSIEPEAESEPVQTAPADPPTGRVPAPDPAPSTSDVAPFPALDLAAPDARGRSGAVAMLAWSLLALFGLTGLGGQLIVTGTVRDPALEPLRAGLCALLGCVEPDRRDPAAIQSRLTVRAHPALEGALLLEAILINTASHAQPFPWLDLTFSDLRGEVVAARRFRPAEYLGGELTGLSRMPARTPVHVSIELEDPGDAALNYQLEVR